MRDLRPGASFCGPELLRDPRDRLDASPRDPFDARRKIKAWRHLVSRHSRDRARINAKVTSKSPL